MAKPAITIDGKKITMNGTINTDDMTIEVEEFTNPVSLVEILNKNELNGKFLKIVFQEATNPVYEADLEE